MDLYVVNMIEMKSVVIENRFFCGLYGLCTW